MILFPKSQGDESSDMERLRARPVPPGNKIKLIYFKMLRLLRMAKKCQKINKRHIFDSKRGEI
jgi:hypothetical protein